MSDNPHSESLLPASLHDSFVHVQMRLFPILEDEFGELDDDHRQFVALCQTVEPLFPHGEFAWCGNGRPPVPRTFRRNATGASSATARACARRGAATSCTWPSRTATCRRPHRPGAGTRKGGAAPGLRRARHRGRAGLPAAGVAQEGHVNRNEAASSRIANAMRGPRHARSASESVRKRPPRPLSHVARPRGRVEAARTRRRRRRCRLRFAPPAKVLQEPQTCCQHQSPFVRSVLGPPSEEQRPSLLWMSGVFAFDCLVEGRITGRFARIEGERAGLVEKNRIGRRRFAERSECVEPGGADVCVQEDVVPAGGLGGPRDRELRVVPVLLFVQNERRSHVGADLDVQQGVAPVGAQPDAVPVPGLEDRARFRSLSDGRIEKDDANEVALRVKCVDSSGRLSVLRHEITYGIADTGDRLVERIPFGLDRLFPKIPFRVGLVVYSANVPAVDPQLAIAEHRAAPTHSRPVVGEGSGPHPFAERFVEENRKERAGRTSDRADRSCGFSPRRRRRLHLRPYPSCAGRCLVGVRQHHQASLHRSRRASSAELLLYARSTSRPRGRIPSSPRRRGRGGRVGASPRQRRSRCGAVSAWWGSGVSLHSLLVSLCICERNRPLDFFRFGQVVRPPDELGAGLVPALDRIREPGQLSRLQFRPRDGAVNRPPDDLLLVLRVFVGGNRGGPLDSNSERRISWRRTPPRRPPRLPRRRYRRRREPTSRIPRRWR